MSKRVQKLPEFKEKFDADTEALSLSWKDELIVIVLLLPIPINFLSVFLIILILIPKFKDTAIEAAAFFIL